MDDAIDAYESLGLKTEAVASQYGRDVLRLLRREHRLSGSDS